MNINVNENVFWLGFWILVAICFVTGSYFDTFKSKPSKDKDPIAQRIDAIENTSIFGNQKAELIKQILNGTNKNEIVVEKK